LPEAQNPAGGPEAQTPAGGPEAGLRLGLRNLIKYSIFLLFFIYLNHIEIPFELCSWGPNTALWLMLDLVLDHE